MLPARTISKIYLPSKHHAVSAGRSNPSKKSIRNIWGWIIRRKSAISVYMHTKIGTRNIFCWAAITRLSRHGAVMPRLKDIRIIRYRRICISAVWMATGTVTATIVTAKLTMVLVVRNRIFLLNFLSEEPLLIRQRNYKILSEKLSPTKRIIMRRAGRKTRYC